MVDIVDKKQINRICELADEIIEHINDGLNEDEMKFFRGFRLFNIKASDYAAVTVTEGGTLWVGKYTRDYERYLERDIEYINRVEGIQNRAKTAIAEAKECYKESLCSGAIAIKELENTVKEL